METSAVAIKLGIEAIKRTAPTAIAWLRTYIMGVDLLILGPKNSGKTSFSDYLVYGIFDDEIEHVSTIEIHKSSMFDIKIGTNSTLKLQVRKTLDVPGQLGGTAHAQLVKEKRPHAILVMLDCKSSAKEMKSWIEEFSRHLNQIFIDDQMLSKKVKSIVICLNKIDKVNSKSTIDARKKAISNILTSELTASRGKLSASKIPILSCVTVVNEKHGPTLANKVIKTIAMQVSKK